MDFTIYTPLTEFVGHICDAAAGIGCLYLLLSAGVVLGFPERRARRCQSYPPVSLLKPLHGEEPRLAERLSALFRQSYEGPTEMICGICDPKDPATAAIEHLVGDVAGANIKLVIDPRERGANRKISNLANMVFCASHDVVVVADSDIEIDTDYLAEVVALLEEPGIGAVTCLYHGVAGAGLWSRFAALAVNAHFLPSIVFALSSRLERPCFGSTIALHRSLLTRIGGFEAFADCLADDYAIGAAVRAAGYKVAVSSFSVGHVHFDRSLWQLIAHELRVARTIRTIRPIAYCGTVIAHPFSLALLACACGSEGSLWLAALALAGRLVLCRCVERRFHLPLQAYWLLPFREMLSFGIFVTSFFGTNVTWRDAVYRVADDGSLFVERNSAS